MTHHVLLEWQQQHLQKALRGEKRALVHLFLTQVKVVVHGLHESTQEVHTGMANAVVLALQSLDHLLAYDLTEAGGEGGRGGGE